MMEAFSVYSEVAVESNICSNIFILLCYTEAEIPASASFLEHSVWMEVDSHAILMHRGVCCLQTDCAEMVAPLSLHRAMVCGNLYPQ